MGSIPLSNVEVGIVVSRALTRVVNELCPTRGDRWQCEADRVLTGSIWLP